MRKNEKGLVFFISFKEYSGEMVYTEGQTVAGSGKWSRHQVSGKTLIQRDSLPNTHSRNITILSRGGREGIKTNAQGKASGKEKKRREEEEGRERGERVSRERNGEEKRGFMKLRRYQEIVNGLF